MTGLLPKVEKDRILVAHVCETAKGGIATYLRLMHRSTSSVAQHYCVLPESHRTELGDDIAAATFVDSGRGCRRLWRLYKTVRLAIRKNQPDIIFFHSTFTLPVMIVLRLLCVPAKFIYCPHGWAALRYPASSFKSRLVGRIEGLLVAFSDAVVNISDFDYDHAKRSNYRGKHRLIENAVAESEGDSIPAPFRRDQPEINLLFIGRFDRQKGLDILLEACDRARKSRDDLRLHIVGESVLGDGRLPQGGSLASSVVFHGWQSPASVQGFCEAADILVVPSRWEGFGLVVPEAFRAGTPVMVSDRSALPGLVERGKSGFVISLSIEAFARQLISLDKRQLDSMRSACRNSYESRFHASRFGNEFCQFFLDLIAK